MWQKIKTLWRITAFRLTIAYTLLFIILAAGLIFYMTGSAMNLLRTQIYSSINEEITALDQVYQARGLNGLMRSMEARARAPGANLYVIVDGAGRIVGGNVRELDRRVLDKNGWTPHPFRYHGFDTDDDEPRYAIARSFALPGELRIILGRDIGEPERFRKIVGSALSFSMLTMLVGGFLIWFFVGRRALRRIDLVSKSTERILAGDQAERLPVTGSNDEFDRLSVRLNQMLDRILRLDDGLRAVSDSIAHDLKTPLTRLRNKLEQMQNSKMSAKALNTGLSEVIDDSDQLIKTFNALLMISRVEAGSQIAEFEPVDLSLLAADIAELYEPVCEEQGIGFSAELADGCRVRGNRELLAQTLTNLFDNALKYGRPENGNAPRLSLRLLKDKKSGIIMELADNGPGIPSDKYEQAKERFFRLDQSRSKPGSGLGLSLVEAVAKLHGGSLVFGDAGPGLIVRLVFDPAPGREGKNTGEN